MKTTDVNLEEAAAESEKDRKDLAKLHADLDELLKHEDAMRIPVAVRRLVDGEIDPVVIAKVLLIGNRDGGLLYKLSLRSAALEIHELAAQRLIALAIRDVAADIAAMMMVSGAAWLAVQFGIDRALLASFVTSEQPRRAVPLGRLGCGALDLVDNDGLGNRAWLVDAIDKAELPSFAPLELTRPR